MQKNVGGIYLDNAATTPMNSTDILYMAQLYKELYGNPSSEHRAGYDAMNAYTDAMISIAGDIGCSPWEIYTTSGGTEADNWALRGVLKQGDHLITSEFEHHAVLNTAKYLETQGVEVTYIKPTSDGMIRLKDIIAAKKPNTKLISIMMVNNEVGTVQPIEEIAAWAKSNDILVHTDAVQAAGHMAINLKNIDVDMMSVSAHKFGGMKNSGFLFIRSNVTRSKAIQPLLYGGNQQNGYRPGTLDAVSTSLMARALHRSIETEIKDAFNLNMKWQSLVDELLAIEGVSLNGSLTNRLFNNVNIRIQGVDAETLVIALNELGVYISAGAACASGNKEPSHVLKAMGRSDQEASESVRISLSNSTTIDEIRMFMERFAQTIIMLREG